MLYFCFKYTVNLWELQSYIYKERGHTPYSGSVQNFPIKTYALRRSIMTYCPFLPYMKCPCYLDKGIYRKGEEIKKRQEKFSFIRFLHASPNAPNLDIYIDGKKAVSNLPYGNLAGYAALQAGSHKIDTYLAGQTTNLILSTTMALIGDNFTTMAIAGVLPNLQYRVYEDRAESIPTNESYIRFVHLSPNTPAVDVVIEAGETLFSAITFGRTKQYKKINPGIYKLLVRASGTPNVLLGLPQLTFEGGKAYTLYAMGVMGGSPPLSVVVLTDGRHMSF